MERVPAVTVGRDSRGMRTLEWEDLDSFLSAPEYLRGYHRVPLPGTVSAQTWTYEFYLEPAVGVPILAHFHGRVPRETASLPFVGGLNLTTGLETGKFVPSDPALALDPELSLAWHAGGPGVDLPRITSAILERLAARWRAPRVVAWGGSGGGYAALRLAGLMDGCVAFAWNPQTDVSEYPAKFSDAYGAALKASGLVPVDEVDDFLGDLTLCRPSFWQGFRGRAIVFQERGDWHFDKHLVPMVVGAGGSVDASVREVTAEVRDRLWLHTSDWKSGHFPPPRPVIVHVLQSLVDHGLDKGRTEWVAGLKKRVKEAAVTDAG